MLARTLLKLCLLLTCSLGAAAAATSRRKVPHAPAVSVEVIPEAVRWASRISHRIHHAAFPALCSTYGAQARPELVSGGSWTSLNPEQQHQLTAAGCKWLYFQSAPHMPITRSSVCVCVLPASCCTFRGCAAATACVT